MPSISLHESQSWTELTVICVITRELRKLNQQPCGLILICQNQSLKVITMILKKVTMKGWNPKQWGSWPSWLFCMVFILPGQVRQVMSSIDKMSLCFSDFLTCICLSRCFFLCDLGNLASHMSHSWHHTGAIVRYWYVYRVSCDAFRSFSKHYPSYALRKHMCGSGLWRGRGTKNKSYPLWHMLL
jgi:hypothetical protein